MKLPELEQFLADELECRKQSMLPDLSAPAAINIYEHAARQRKVLRIIPHLLRAKITAEELSHASDTEWSMVHTALGINHTGPETRAMCIAMLREIERG